MPQICGRRSQSSAKLEDFAVHKTLINEITAAMTSDALIERLNEASTHNTVHWPFADSADRRAPNEIGG